MYLLFLQKLQESKLDKDGKEQPRANPEKVFYECIFFIYLITRSIDFSVCSNESHPLVDKTEIVSSGKMCILIMSWDILHHTCS